MSSARSLRWTALALVLGVGGCRHDTPTTITTLPDADEVGTEDVEGDTNDEDTGETDTTDEDTGETDTGETDTGDIDTSEVDTGEADTDEADTAEDTADDTGDEDTAEDVSDADTTPVTWDPEAITENEAIFPLYVQAGAMRHDSAVLWTYVFEERRPIAVRVWPEDAPDASPLYADIRTESGDDGYTHVVVEGLDPGLWYRYAFFDLDDAGELRARSRIGRFRSATAPGDAQPITIGATHGTSFSYAPYQALEITAGFEPDFFLHLGDLAYNDGAETLQDFRDNWWRTIQDDGFEAILQATGFYMTWDDHEITNNYDPETINAAVLLAGKRSFWETFPLLPGESGQLWNSYRWGDTLELFVLDCRTERLPSTRGEEDVYISASQMEWLKAGLQASEAHFQVIANSVPITNMPSWYFSSADRWEGYPRQRDELIGFITTSGLDNVWFLGGDFHIGMVSRVDPDGPGVDIYEISPGPGGNIGPGTSLSTLPTPDGQFLFHTNSLQPEIATSITFDPERDQVHVHFVNAANDDVLYDAWLPE